VVIECLEGLWGFRGEYRASKGGYGCLEVVMGV